MIIQKIFENLKKNILKITGSINWKIKAYVKESMSFHLQKSQGLISNQYQIINKKSLDIVA